MFLDSGVEWSGGFTYVGMSAITVYFVHYAFGVVFLIGWLFSSVGLQEIFDGGGGRKGGIYVCLLF